MSRCASAASGLAGWRFLAWPARPRSRRPRQGEKAPRRGDRCAALCGHGHYGARLDRSRQAALPVPPAGPDQEPFARAHLSWLIIHPRPPRWIMSQDSGFSAAIRRIRVTVSGDSGGRPGPGRDFRRQNDRYPARCQRSSVSGRTRRSASRQPRTRPASSTNKARSAGVKTGRLTLRRRTSSCWRRRAFSASSCPPGSHEVGPRPR